MDSITKSINTLNDIGVGIKYLLQFWCLTKDYFYVKLIYRQMFPRKFQDAIKLFQKAKWAK